MSDEILWRSLDIYAPFAPAQVRLLRSFVSGVRELIDDSFFEQVPTSVRLFGTARGPAMEEPRRELTRGTAVLFRQLYKPNEEASFVKVIRCLGDSVRERDCPDSSSAMAALKGITDWQKRVLRFGSGLRVIYADGTHSYETRPQKMLDTYLYGVWVHRNNANTERAEAWDRSNAVARYTAYQLMARLMPVYIYAANVADAVLAEPTLTEASGS